MTKQNIEIGWLYPDLMSTYGDRGNIIVLRNRCERRGISVNVKRLDVGFSKRMLSECDILFMGGAQDQQQKIVAEDLKRKADVLTTSIENGIAGLFICGAYQFLGKYYKEADGTLIYGLGILDIYTEHPGADSKRLTGNVIAECSSAIIDLREGRKKTALIGFENHGGRTYLGSSVKPLGKVLHGYGNNGRDKTEGARFKNIIGTYLHGPILPKNSYLADWIIKKSLERKTSSPVKLSSLPFQDLEEKARMAIVKRYCPGL